MSLVATVLNEAAALPALLRSIDAQTLQPDEVVVVDGGSADGTIDMLEAWAGRRSATLVLRAPGANISAGRNLAIARVRGEIVAVTDAGVVLDPAWLERLVGALASETGADVASGFFVPEAHGVFERALGATILPHLRDVDPSRFLPSSRSVAFRRSAWAAAGGYPEWLDYGEDLVFDLALRRAGSRFVWVSEAIVRFRPRRSLAAFFRQYYRYARGDGKADLWRLRHAARYAAYVLGPLVLWRGRQNPLILAAALGAGWLYLRRPVQRLLDPSPSANPVQIAAEGGVRSGILPGGSEPMDTLRALSLIPVIRVVGDVAKMVGYPVGVAWRLAGYKGRAAGNRRLSGDASTPPVAPQPCTLPPVSRDLSVIIVSYNTESRLEACLRSIESSVGVLDMETYVVDNASTDGSAELVESEFPWVHLIRSKKNGGYAYANNLALRRARGCYLLLLNPDTELGSTALSDMMAYLEAHPEAGAAGPKLVRADGMLDLACRRSFPTPSVAFYRLVGLARLFPRSRRFGRYNLTYLDPDVETEVDALTGAFMLVRREAVEGVGLLDERFFMYGEDLDWAYRMKGQGWRIRYNPGVTVLHHKGESSRQASQRATIVFYRAMRLFYEKHYRRKTVVALDRLIIASIYGWLGWSLLRNALRPPEQRRVSP